MADEVVIEPAAPATPAPSPGADLGSPPPVAGSGIAGPTPAPTSRMTVSAAPSRADAPSPQLVIEGAPR